MWRYTGHVWKGTAVRRACSVVDSITRPSVSVLATSTCRSSSFSSSSSFLSKRTFCSTTGTRARVVTTGTSTANIAKDRLNYEDMGAKGTSTVDTTLRLQNIRRLMRQGDGGVDAFVVPSEDQREFSIFYRNDLS